MADSIDGGHGTSDEYTDPFCDLCFEAKGLNVKVIGYCKDCFQFLCTECHVFHRKLHAARGHTVVRGADMPQSQAAKPPKFDYCDAHPKKMKDQFCIRHKVLLCTLCVPSHHKDCSVGGVDEICKTIHATEIDALFDTINGFKGDMTSAMSVMDSNITKIGKQRKDMFEEVQTMYDKIISKVNQLFQEIKADIESKCQSELLKLSQYQDKLKYLISSIELTLDDLDQFKGEPVDTKTFLRIQDVIKETDQCKTDVETLNQTFKTSALSFVPDQLIKDFLSSSFKMGSVAESKYSTPIAVPDTVFPVSSPTPALARQQPSGRSRSAAESQSASKSIPLVQIKGRKQKSYNIKLPDDEEDCRITGIAITKDGRRLLADYSNYKVKMFSADMKFLSSVSLSDAPWAIAILSDNEAAVSMCESTLIILDISAGQMRIKHERNITYNVYGITKFKDKLVVTCPNDSPPSVKLIDQTGKVYWSVFSNNSGLNLFVRPYYVSSHGDGRSSSQSVTVTDRDNVTLTLLNGETGEVITTRQPERKRPLGVTTDTDGNIYVCYVCAYQVAVLTGDLSEERILLSRQDGLSDVPQAIVIDDAAHQLVISYHSGGHTNSIDYFQL